MSREQKKLKIDIEAIDYYSMFPFSLTHYFQSTDSICICLGVPGRRNVKRANRGLETKYKLKCSICDKKSNWHQTKKLRVQLVRKLKDQLRKSRRQQLNKRKVKKTKKAIKNKALLSQSKTKQGIQAQKGNKQTESKWKNMELNKIKESPGNNSNNKNISDSLTATGLLEPEITKSGPEYDIALTGVDFGFDFDLVGDGEDELAEHAKMSKEMQSFQDNGINS